jgi:putative nucleotidyltransferase with HDIG domain
MFDETILDQYIERTRGLPPAPVVATQLLSLFGNPDRDIDRIVELISLDPSLTAEVLKRCNSAYMGLGRPVRDMFEAVFQIGFYEVYCIVIAFVGSRSLSMVQNKAEFDADPLWQHSVVTAVAASILGRRVGATEAVAFTAGLLHDIGKLVFASVEGAGYADLIRRSAPFGPSMVEAEEESFGFNHADLGARLLTRWNLPGSVCVAVLRHPLPPNGEREPDSLSLVAKVANYFAHELQDGSEQDRPSAAPGAETLEALGLTPANIPPLLQEIRGQLKQVEALFGA